MRRIALIAATVIGSAVLSLSPLSIKYLATQKSVAVSEDKANAAVGKPLSAGSVAGVHRRQERRQHHQNTAPK
jgi:hypothetical protein